MTLIQTPWRRTIKIIIKQWKVGVAVIMQQAPPPHHAQIHGRPLWACPGKNKSIIGLLPWTVYRLQKYGPTFAKGRHKECAVYHVRERCFISPWCKHPISAGCHWNLILVVFYLANSALSSLFSLRVADWPVRPTLMCRLLSVTALNVIFDCKAVLGRVKILILS